MDQISSSFCFKIEPIMSSNFMAFDPPGCPTSPRTGVFARREFAVLDVVCIKFRVVLPLFGKVIQRKNRGDRTDRHAGPKIDAFHGINVELGDLIEARTAVIVSRVFLRVNAIYGAGIDASGVFCPNAGVGNDIGHGPPPLCRSTHYASAREDSSGGQGFPQSRCRIRCSGMAESSLSN